jgi:hypothetical protein
VEAISGADIVEKRSNLVRLMANLFDKVLVWGEKLIYQGTKDDSLPPAVLQALDAYLAESNSKLLVVLPLKDERESESKKPPRSGLMMECFDPAQSPEQLVARLEVVGRHATSALYNAAEHRRIPMRFIWQPIAAVQEGLGGKARAIILGIAAGLLLLLLVLVFVPYPLKMDAKGQLLPQDRRYIYAPEEGKIMHFLVAPGDTVLKDRPLAIMHDATLAERMQKLQSDIESARQKEITMEAELPRTKAEQRLSLSGEIAAEVITRDLKYKELQELKDLVHAVPDMPPGYFQVLSPIDGTVLNSNFREELSNKTVKPNEPILRLGKKDGRWEVELKIPQKNIGQVLQAYKTNDPNEELDVDLILRSVPTHTYKAKLARKEIGGEAQPDRDENNEAEPVVRAYVRIEGDDIVDAVPKDQSFRVTGTEVVAKIRCGPHAMGYSLFYGVWEFFYEKIVFFF